MRSAEALIVIDVGDEQAHRIRTDIDRSDSHVAAQLSFNPVSKAERCAPRLQRCMASG
jgi:hypothetical protein